MNKMCLTFKSRVENEAFARTSALAFLMPLNPNVDEIMEIKTLVAEAITNAIIHGYEGNPDGLVKLEIGYEKNNLVTLIISDKGVGIEDVDQAMQPLFTTKENLERSGMGMTIMNTFSDSFDVISQPKEGTTIVIQKQLHKEPESTQ